MASSICASLRPVHLGVVLLALVELSAFAAEGDLTATGGVQQVTSNAANNSAGQQAAAAQLHEREFVSPQARIQMDCQRDRTVIKVNFTRPFNGILGAGPPESTKCKVLGNARDKYYELQVLHNATDECDAKWDSATSSIANTLFVRFHQSLETGADIVKNVLCRLTVGDLIVGRRPQAGASQANTSANLKKQQNNKIIKANKRNHST